MKAIQRLSIFAVVFCVLGWTIQQTFLVADQPNSILPSNHGVAASTEPAKVTPPTADSQDEQAAMRADPLFQAILQQFKEGRGDLSTEDLTSRPKSDGLASDSITPEQWQAIELILRAARIFEDEEKRLAARDDLKKSTVDIQPAIQLRGLVLQIIRNGLKP